MRKFYSVKTHFLVAVILIGQTTVSGQTNPTPVALAPTGSYQQNFGTAAFSTYPAGWNSWQTNSQATIISQAAAESSTPLADAAITALNGAPATNTSPGTYGALPVANDAKMLIATVSSNATDPNRVNQIVLALNTTGRINIVVAYQLQGLNVGTNRGTVCQYRVGTTGSWSTVTATGNPFVNTAGPTSVSFTLPAAANNAPVVQIRWAVWNGETTNNSNLRYRYYLDNISISSTAKPVETLVWEGDVSSLWSTPGNWNLNRVPASDDNVLISNPNPNNPVLDVDFTLGTGRTLLLAAPAALSINPARILTIAGDADFGGRRVTLISDATGSGMIGQITGTLAFATNVQAQRWFSSRRAFRFVSSPVDNAVGETVRQQWMAFATQLGVVGGYPYPPGTPQNPSVGRGTHITGPNPTVNGFDETMSHNPSLFSWEAAANNWAAVPTTNFRTLAGTPWRLFVRGDRGTNLDDLSNNPPSSETRILNTGALIVGNKTISGGTVSTSANGYSMIGNPYQCVVDATLITRTNQTGFMYVWDANIAGTNGRGGYVTVDLSTNTNNVAGSQANKWIQPGQAVFFQNNASVGPFTTTFVESAKGTPANRVLVFGIDEEPTTPDNMMSIALFAQEDVLINQTPKDGVVIRFGDSFTNLASEEDGNDFANPDETMSVLNNSRNISIDKRLLPADGEIIPLTVSRYRGTNYSMQVDASAFNQPGMDAYLKDAFLNTETLLPAGQVTNVNFTVDNAIAASTAANRFSIVFRAGTVLPIRYTNLSAVQQGTGVSVNWEVAGDHQGSTYQIERSANGQTFIELDVVQGKGTGSTEPTQYNWLDQQPNTGNNYYRIKGVDRFGDLYYSNVARVVIGGKSEGIDIYPNPVTGGFVQVNFANIPKGNYETTLVNMAGQQLQKTTVQHDGGSASRQIRLAQKMAPGSYVLVLQSGNNVYKQTVLVQ